MHIFTVRSLAERKTNTLKKCWNVHVQWYGNIDDDNDNERISSKINSLSERKQKWSVATESQRQLCSCSTLDFNRQTNQNHNQPFRRIWQNAFFFRACWATLYVSSSYSNPHRSAPRLANRFLSSYLGPISWPFFFVVWTQTLQTNYVHLR